MRHLDANILIAYLNGNEAISNKIEEYSSEVAVSTIVIAELIFGAHNSKQPEQNLNRLETHVLQTIPVVLFDVECADRYARVRIDLNQKGKPTGAMDLLIASIALAHNAILVTHNTKHFEHIDGLILEDWLA